MLWRGDTTGRCVFLSRAMREFWGLGPDDCGRFDWSSSLLAEDQAPAAPGQIVDPTLEAAGDEAGVPEAPEARQTGKDGLPSDHDDRSGNGGVADDDGFQEGNR